MLTKFSLHMVFNGNYDKGCMASFSLVDSADQKLYDLQFRLNYKGYQKKIIQAAESNGATWDPVYIHDLPVMRVGNSYMTILITDLFYELRINDKVVKPRFPVDWTRLDSLSHFTLESKGECLKIEADDSFVAVNDLTGICLHIFSLQFSPLLTLVTLLGNINLKL